jgi:hypothetical protein
VQVVHYGLGPIGRSIATLVAAHPDLEARAAIDLAPELRGRALSEVIGTSSWTDAPQVVGTLEEAELDGAVVAVHSTGSRIAAVAPQVLALVERGLHVISTCEELSFASDDHTARAIDRSARARGVAVLGTGVNPGFAMDYLPITLSGIMPSVERVTVRRVQDAALRRLPLQRKVGAGLTPEQFRGRVEAGSLGHVGLRQSALAIASAFGWLITSYVEQTEPVVAGAVVSSALGDISPGRVLGIHQTGRAFAGDRVLIELDLTIAIGASDPMDEVLLEGGNEIEMRIPRGLPGDIATAAIVVNAIPRLIEAKPGLRTMADIAPPHPWRSDSRAYAPSA